MAQALNVLGMLDARRGAARPGRGPAAGEPGARTRPARPGGGGGRAQQPGRLLADSGQPAEALLLAQEALALGRELGDQHRVAALHTNLADLLHAAGQREAALAHLKEAARGFASVDTGGTPRPEVWTLVEW